VKERTAVKNFDSPVRRRPVTAAMPLAGINLSLGARVDRFTFGVNKACLPVPLED
jgi:hypothetical protein